MVQVLSLIVYASALCKFFSNVKLISVLSRMKKGWPLEIQP